MGSKIHGDLEGLSGSMHPEVKKTVIAVIALSVFAILLAVALNTDWDDDDGGKCGTCENPPTIEFYLYQREIRQTGLQTYNAIYRLEGFNFILELNASEVALPGFLEEDDLSGGPHFVFVDVDQDSQVTMGDELRLINMTLDHIGKGFNLTCGGEFLCYMVIGWDRDDPSQYLVASVFLNDKVLSNGRGVTYLKCTMNETVMGPHVEDIDFGFVDKYGVVVVDAFASWDDDDGDGRASSGDVVRVEFTPYTYNRFTLQFIVDGHLVGFVSIDGSPDTT